MKQIILCADDYGVSKSVGEAIRELLVAQRISAISCLSTAPDWPTEATLLRPLCNQFDVGLHFNLTQGFKHCLPSLNKQLVNSLTGQINKAVVGREFRNQLQQFELAFGKAPDFIDGHQHIHIFPEIRNIVFHVLADYYPSTQRPWVRQVNPSLTGHDALLKALILRILSLGFRTAAKSAGFALTSSFAGLYSLSENANYPALMGGWLKNALPGTLVMCHPSMTDDHPEGYGTARVREFHYLLGQEFGAVLKNENIALTRFQCLQ